MDQRIVRVNHPMLGDGVFDRDIDDTAILPGSMGALGMTKTCQPSPNGAFHDGSHDGMETGAIAAAREEI